MSAGQREAHGVVIELRIQPVIGAVAAVAGGRELGGDVIRVGGRVEIRRVAGIALGRHRLKLAVGSALVAGIAIDGRMSARQRKAVVVLLDLLDRHLPAAHGVALLAVRSQLTLVNIGMAVLAAVSDVGEHWFDVALNAGHRLVHAAQRIARLIVIEFRNRADRPPSVGRVAVLTGDIQIAVRTVSARRSLCLRVSRDCGQRQQQYCPTD